MRNNPEKKPMPEITSALDWTKALLAYFFTNGEMPQKIKTVNPTKTSEEKK